MATAGAGASRRSRTLLLLILLSVGFGVVAAFVASPSVSPGQSAPPAYHPVPAYLFVDLLAIGVPTLVILWIVNAVVRRYHQGAMPIANLALLSFILVSLIVLGLLSLGGLLHQSAWPGQPVGSGPSGGGSPSGGGVNGNGTPNFSTGPAPPAPPITLPLWGWYLLAAGALGGTLAVLLLFSTALRRNPDGEAGDAKAAVREEFIDALARLAESRPEDPRELIRALYARLLLALQRSFDTTEVLTPREIEALLVTKYGVRAEPAHALTRLFEEARYSRRPLPPDAVVRTRGALELILVDLGGSVPAGRPTHPATWGTRG